MYLFKNKARHVNYKAADPVFCEVTRVSPWKTFAHHQSYAYHRLGTHGLQKLLTETGRKLVPTFVVTINQNSTTLDRPILLLKHSRNKLRILTTQLN